MPDFKPEMVAIDENAFFSTRACSILLAVVSFACAGHHAMVAVLAALACSHRRTLSCVKCPASGAEVNAGPIAAKAEATLATGKAAIDLSRWRRVAKIVDSSKN